MAQDGTNTPDVIVPCNTMKDHKGSGLVWILMLSHYHIIRGSSEAKEPIPEIGSQVEFELYL